MTRKLSYAKAINEAMFIAMRESNKVVTFGLGVPDPKGVFGTTLGLQEEFGNKRVLDMPTSENAMTGIGIGLALSGYRPVMVHQRVDFFLLALDQLINNAAKWDFMFGGGQSVPITIRLIVGHGWGQGPTHSQNLQAMFSHIPGIKVVMPTSAYDAKGLLLESIFDDSPTIFLEHRWLHGLESEVPEIAYRVNIGEANLLNQGSDLTIVALSYMTVEAKHAVKELNNIGISCDLIDLRSTSPLDMELIKQSVKKTGRILAVDSSSQSFSVASEIIAQISMDPELTLKDHPKIVALEDSPAPSSFGLTEKYYNSASDIFKVALSVFGKLPPDNLAEIFFLEKPHDIPGDWFKGPF